MLDCVRACGKKQLIMFTCWRSMILMSLFNLILICMLKHTTLEVEYTNKTVLSKISWCHVYKMAAASVNTSHAIRLFI